MPRPSPSPAPAPTSAVDFEHTFVRVESPTAYYSGSAVKVAGRRVIVSGAGFEDEFTLDAEPELNDIDQFDTGAGAVVGFLSGRPFVVVVDSACRCQGSRKVPR